MRARPTRCPIVFAGLLALLLVVSAAPLHALALGEVTNEEQNASVPPEFLLLVAIAAGDTPQVKRLLDEGADVNADLETIADGAGVDLEAEMPELAKLSLLERQAYGRAFQPLTAAIQRNDLEIVKVLIDAGAEIDAIHLATAVIVSDPEIVEVVIESGDHTDHLGRSTTIGSLLIKAAVVRRDDPEIAALIQAAEASPAGGSEAGSVEADRAALQALYRSTAGRGWTESTNWLTEAPLGDWYGVDTNAEGRIDGLELGSSWSGNGLRGAIPPELAGLTELRSLQLGGNELSGRIPPELGRLTKLETLDLSGSLEVSLSRSFAEGLRQGLTRELGEEDALAEAFAAAFASTADSLAGPIPPELGNLTNLRSLNLRNNRLSGPIPRELAQLTNLERLDLAGNKLTGRIPRELGQLTELRTLRLRDNDLSGRIPSELAQLANLVYLNFEGNALTCAPTDHRLLSWLGSRRRAVCGEDPSFQPALNEPSQREANPPTGRGTVQGPQARALPDVDTDSASWWTKRRIAGGAMVASAFVVGAFVDSCDLRGTTSLFYEPVMEDGRCLVNERFLGPREYYYDFRGRRITAVHRERGAAVAFASSLAVAGLLALLWPSGGESREAAFQVELVPGGARLRKSFGF